MSDRNEETTAPAWFAALRGRWRLRRCVLVWAAPSQPDAAGWPHVEARLTGEVRLDPAESAIALHYEETGVLRLRHGALLQSKRRYLYRCEVGESQQQLAIDFADGPSAGLPFVQLPWPALSERDAAEGEDLHLCGADRYRVRYRFETLHGAMTSVDKTIDGNGKVHTRPGAEAVAWDRIKQRGDEAESREGDNASPLWHRIVQRTRVRGPKKDYAIVSILDRIEA
ncbi:DUF6314 family protein [Robbsia sp. KACC 23696]|uniref:DUF6314 family protein n=1 Tax=Robbsia sp. KACC 23696 TaxID=3149231 RepID=UPI00325ABCD5